MDDIWERLKAAGTPVLLRDLNPQLQAIEQEDGPKDSETVVGYYLPDDKQYIH